MIDDTEIECKVCHERFELVFDGETFEGTCPNCGTHYSE